MAVHVDEDTKTTGRYLGIAIFEAYDMKINVQIEISLKRGKAFKKTRSLTTNDYIPAYTLVNLSLDGIIQGKFDALMDRRKPRGFYD